MKTGIGEFLEKVGKLSKTTDKINALRANDCLVTRIILQAAYDDSVVFDLPPGEPPYTPNKLVDQEHMLLHEIENSDVPGVRFRYYIKGFRNDIPSVKKETMFVELLERVAPKDASLLCAIKDKKPIKGITLAHVREAFPGMIQGKNEESKILADEVNG